MPILCPDRELVERSRRGDSAAFGELWSRYERQVVAVCRGYLAGPARDASADEHDLATETFLRALRHLDRFEDRDWDTAFRAWLLEIARNVCLNHLTRQRRRQRWCSRRIGAAAELDPLAPTAGIQHLVEQRDTLRRVVEEVEALPPPYRACFTLILADRSQREIAAALGISVENAKKRVQRARRMLQDRLSTMLDPADVADVAASGPPASSSRPGSCRSEPAGCPPGASPSGRRAAPGAAGAGPCRAGSSRETR